MHDLSAVYSSFRVGSISLIDLMEILGIIFDM